MKQRSISAIGVVLIGLIPAIIGGPIFAIVFGLVCLVALHELLGIVGMQPRDRMTYVAYAVVVVATAMAALGDGHRTFPVVVALAAFGPLALGVLDDAEDSPDLIGRWARTTAATLYLALPAFAAISLRSTQGFSERSWLDSLSDALSFTNTPTGKGLGWLLLAILVTWLSDTVAYLVGRSIGKTPLLPRVSPKKTVEGAAGGIIAAGLTGLICTLAFGLHVHPLTGLLVGVVLGVVGILGDLCESLLKRRAGVKDSGTLIPGHGGFLDRIDAMIFVIVTTWLLLPFLP
ncbi:MAG: phosphatidate cytidylyltransferase [Thermomicrobiales bacterium]